MQVCMTNGNKYGKKKFHDQYSQKIVADPAGFEPAPPDHQSDAYPTDPLRPSIRLKCQALFSQQKKNATYSHCEASGLTHLE